MATVHDKLERDRRDLIDLSLRNNLVNFRLTSARGVQVIDEQSDSIYKLLVNDGRSMDFLASSNESEPGLIFKITTSFLPEWFIPQLSAAALLLQCGEAVPEDANTWMAQPEDDESEKDPQRHTDNHLQTPHNDRDLQKRLLNTSVASREHIEERGINVLFLALGELTWFESDASDRALRAPLLMVPVQISRKAIDARFMIAYNQTGVVENVALREKLRTEFGIKLPELLSEHTDENDLIPSRYFAEIRHAVAHKSRWHVSDNDINLGLFSFAKLLMFHDLDAAAWPSDEQPANHPVLKALLETGFSNSLYSASDRLSSDEIDNYLGFDKNHHVVDADSSQAQAIHAVGSGRSLAIQGPPGTGKSQTIANIIAEAIGRGKTILFVAEKAAALEVVRRRLNRVQLGDLCLELHSHKANRQQVIEELRKAINLGSPKLDTSTSDVSTMDEMRQALNAYSAAVNEPIGESKITPYRAFGEVLRLNNILASAGKPDFATTGYAHWTAHEYQERRTSIGTWQSALSQYGSPRNNVFWGSQLSVTTPATSTSVQRLARKALGELRLALTSSGEFCDTIGFSYRLVRLSDLDALARWAAAVCTLSETTTCLDASQWHRHASQREQLLEAASVVEATAAVRVYVNDDVSFASSQFDEIAQTVVTAGRSLFRFLNSKYRSAIHELELLVKSLPSDNAERTETLSQLTKYHKAQRVIMLHSDIGAALYGQAWKGADSDWMAIHRLDQAASDLAADAHELVDLQQILAAPGGRRRAQDALHSATALVEHTTAFSDLLSQLYEFIRFDTQQRWGVSSSRDCLTSDLVTQLQSWETTPDAITDLAALHLADSSVGYTDLRSFMSAMRHWEHAPTHALDAFDYAYFGALVEEVLKNRPALGTFQRLSHEDKLRRFRELDQKQLFHNRQRTLVKHHGSVRLDGIAGQALVLKQELEKKRRHRTIRRLIADAYDPILKLKPVFMMSPLSVANYLQPGTIRFDLAIFDEASQVRPADAYGAILRANQVVVVGDNKQLPPTSFFDVVDDSEDEESAGDYESILGKFNSQGITNHVLRWHYRSAHEALIAVSNLEYYDNQLLFAPSPHISTDDLGLKYHRLDGTYYMPGASVNQGEALAVAKSVMNHARRHPDVTLGVAAFSIKQAQAIRDEIERMRKESPTTEEFFTEYGAEPFFIKNLENVQGDERDVIFISIGYGKTRDGRVNLNFGPLNRSGGERRLNVLITRARLRCEVFTNLSADDLNLDGKHSRGLASLKRYLRFAETGDLELAMPSDREADSVFEEVVASALRERGYTVHHQIGTAGFYVDLAIVDADCPGRYVIGIECDGASYHSAASARDRDRLRQSILESKGWQIHRIWSTDWFRNPAREVERAIQVIEQAKQNSNVGVPREIHRPIPPVVTRDSELASDAQVQISAFAFRPYQPAPPLVGSPSAPIEEIPTYALQNAINHVLRHEGPMHRDQIVSKVAAIFGAKRARQNAQVRIGALLTPNLYDCHTNFYWVKGMSIVPRNRAGLPTAQKLSSHVAPAELRIAIFMVIQHYQPIVREEVGPTTWGLLGFNRVSADMKVLAEQQVDSLLSKGKVTVRNGHLEVRT